MPHWCHHLISVRQAPPQFRRTNGNVVVVIQTDQVSELQMTCQAGCLAGNTLHGTTVTENDIGVVVDEVKARLVDLGGSVCLGHGQTNGVAEALTQRTSGNLDTIKLPLRVTWGPAVDLLGTVRRKDRSQKATHAEALEIIHGGGLVAEKVQQDVQQRTGVSIGEHKAITVDPVGILGIEGHKLVEEDVGSWRKTHWSTRMPRVAPGDHVGLRQLATASGKEEEADGLYREDADGVDGSPVILRVAHCGRATRYQGVDEDWVVAEGLGSQKKVCAKTRFKKDFFSAGFGVQSLMMMASRSTFAVQ